MFVITEPPSAMEYISPCSACQTGWRPRSEGSLIFAVTSRKTTVPNSPTTEQTAEEHLIYRMGRVVAHANAHLEKKLRPLGLTIDSFRVLFVLSRIPARTVKQLASDTIIHKSTLSRQLARMERANLVRRMSEHEDGRYVTIRLTESGRIKFRKAIRVATSEYNRLAAGLSTRDVSSFSSVLDFIARNVIPSKQRDERLFVSPRSSTEAKQGGCPYRKCHPCSRDRRRWRYIDEA